MGPYRTSDGVLHIYSPQGHELRQLDGNPGDIDTHGQGLVDASQVMWDVVFLLEKIASGTDSISKAVSMDDVRESAGDVAPQLEKAAIRYKLTGDALVTYADALDLAQREIRPKIDDIWEKYHAVSAASGEYSELQRTTMDPSPSELDDAKGKLDTAEDELRDAWDGFDQVFGVWEEAYDTAVGKIDDAFDRADNNDAWGEDFLAVLGYVGIALCVVALFCTGPIAVVIAAIGAAVAVLVVVINALKFGKGRGNWLDLGVAIASVIPFVRPLYTAAKGIKTVGAAKAMLTSGKTTLRSSLKSTVRVRTRSGSRPGVPKITTRSPSQITNIADKKTANLLDEFDRGNSILNRVKMIAFGGGHSDVAAFGNFVRSKGADKVGGEVLEWAANNAPAASGVMKTLVGVENGISGGSDLYFLAEEHIPEFNAYVARFGQ